MMPMGNTCLEVIVLSQIKYTFDCQLTYLYVWVEIANEDRCQWTSKWTPPWLAPSHSESCPQNTLVLWHMTGTKQGWSFHPWLCCLRAKWTTGKSRNVIETALGESDALPREMPGHRFVPRIIGDIETQFQCSLSLSLVLCHWLPGYHTHTGISSWTGTVKLLNTFTNLLTSSQPTPDTHSGKTSTEYRTGVVHQIRPSEPPL